MTTKLTKKQQEQVDVLLRHKVNVALTLTIIGIFFMGIILNIIALVQAVDVKNSTKDQSNRTKAIVVMTLAIAQLVINGFLLLVAIGSM